MPNEPHPPWIENEALFKAELADGHRWAEAVGTRLIRSGLPARVSPMSVRDNVGDIPEYADELDSVVGDQNPIVIESKSRRLSFTEDPDSYPYETAFVDTCNGWDAKSTKPRAIVLVSQHTTAMLGISVRTRSSWTVTRTFDRVRRIYDDWYLVPKAQLQPFDHLVDWLHTRPWTYLTDPPHTSPAGGSGT
jgi:hypothetical protein